MCSDGYDRMLELVAENPGLEAEELVEMAADEGIAAADAHQWLGDAEATGDVIERDEKYWAVRGREFAFGEFDRPA